AATSFYSISLPDALPICLPGDRAVGRRQVDAAEGAHEQAADQRRLNVVDARGATGGHQDDDEHERGERVRRLAGGRRHFVDFGGDRKSTRLNSSHVKISY